MPLFDVTFERSAIQVRTFMVDAHNEDNARAIATNAMAGRADKRVKSQAEAFSGDGESSWECVEVEQCK
jgi:hypothetical protein